MTIIPTHHEKMEWSRLAQAAYASGRNDIGHRFSVAATHRNQEPMDLMIFDALQADYRTWLIGGFDEFAPNGHPWQVRANQTAQHRTLKTAGSIITRVDSPLALPAQIWQIIRREQADKSSELGTDSPKRARNDLAP